MSTPTRDKTQPDPAELITLIQAARESGLNRSTLYKQAQAGRIPNRGVEIKEDRGKDLEKRWRASGGGTAVVVTRRALHEYLWSRGRPSRNGGQGPKLIPRSYRTPRGMMPLPEHMLEPLSDPTPVSAGG